MYKTNVNPLTFFIVHWRRRRRFPIVPGMPCYSVCMSGYVFNFEWKFVACTSFIHYMPNIAVVLVFLMTLHMLQFSQIHNDEMGWRNSKFYAFKLLIYATNKRYHWITNSFDGSKHKHLNINACFSLALLISGINTRAGTHFFCSLLRFLGTLHIFKHNL